MICYRDMTFCTSWRGCKQGETCSRALTDDVEACAEKWWGKPGAPICLISGVPDCFEVRDK